MRFLLGLIYYILSPGFRALVKAKTRGPDASVRSRESVVAVLERTAED